MYAITSNSLRAISEGMALQAGETIVAEVPAALATSMRGEQMKAERGQRLRATDWTQMPDAPLTALEKAAYQTYRQALRDLPSLPGFPDVPWPMLPTIRDGTASSGEGAVYP
ncbi:tail fiber assembly protein [Stenotrophomonas sp. AR029]|uniref:tail fiber assembly protein n=1 Tax=Stenotrophomonas sp. AR029 TaxID=3398601 RepID=UPI0039C5C7AC